MNAGPKVTFFHGINSRSTGARILLEELGADYELKLLNFKTGEQRAPDYLAINPMGKVPAVLHDGALVTEQVAVFIYLADLYAGAGLAPPIGDPLRGPYLRWIAFYGACYEPAVIDRSQQRAPAPPSTSPYGDFDTMFKTLCDQLARADYILGERFTAADVLWGTALEWTTGFGLVPATPDISAYIERVMSRPAAQRVKSDDARLAAAQGS